MFGTWPEADNVAQIGGPRRPIMTDGGPGYARCEDCGETYRSLSAARICCSDNQDDDDPDSVPLLCDGGRIDPLVCPRGHHAVEITARRFSCQTCRQQGRETTAWDKSELVDLRDGDPPMAADGGQPMQRPKSTDEVSPAVVESLESRVDSLEDNQQRADQTRTDLVALINDLQTQVDELRTRVEHLEDDAGGDPQ